MSSQLRAIVAYGSNIETAIQAALNQYNNVEARKIFHRTEIKEDLIILRNDDTFTTRVTLWFTATVDDPVEEAHDYIGFRGIDPNDPNWKEKWDEELAQNASVTSQEGSGATETTNE
jgi:hypothetical protein